MKWLPIALLARTHNSIARANARQWVTTGFTASRAILAPVLLWPGIDPFFAFYWFVGLALVDAFDGMLARKLRTQSSFGKALDSFADGILIACASVSYAARFPDPLLLIRILIPLVMAAIAMYAVRLARPNSRLGSLSGTIQISYYFSCLFACLYLYGLAAHPDHPGRVTIAGVVLALFFGWLKLHRAHERARHLYRMSA